VPVAVELAILPVLDGPMFSPLPALAEHSLRRRAGCCSEPGFKAASHEPRSWRIASYILLAVYPIAATLFLVAPLPATGASFPGWPVVYCFWGLLERSDQGTAKTRCQSAGRFLCGFGRSKFCPAELALAICTGQDSRLAGNPALAGTHLTLVVERALCLWAPSFERWNPQYQ